MLSPRALARLLIFKFSLLVVTEDTKAHWSPVPLPTSAQGQQVVTTAPVNARCQQVFTAGDIKSCHHVEEVPSFDLSKNEVEVLRTLPAGETLQILAAHRDTDGYAVQVQSAQGEKFWIFEAHSSSKTRLGDQPLGQLLSDAAVAAAVEPLQALASSTAPLTSPACYNDTAQASTHVPQIPNLNSSTNAGVGFYELCSDFITETGELGALGETLVEELRADHRADLYDEDVVLRLTAIHELCPNFSSFTASQKERFWVWTFMAISHVESKCGHQMKGRILGPSGHHPWGHLQMEWRNQGLDGVRSKWASNPNPENACAAPDITEPEANIACGLDTMLTFVRGYYTCSKQEYPGQPPVLHDPESCTVPLSANYWEEMRRPDQAISRRIKDFAACGAQP